MLSRAIILLIASFFGAWPAYATGLEAIPPSEQSPDLPETDAAATATAAATNIAATSPASVTDGKIPPTLATSATEPAPREEAPQIANTAVLQGLNKVTGHVSKLEGPIGSTLHFGNLEIIPRRCWKSAPEDRPEDAILLEIRELKSGEESKRIFLGWMFASSPGLSGLEHPVYDVNVLACEYRVHLEEPPAEAAGGKEAPAKKAESGKPAKKGKKSSSKRKKPAAQQ